MKFATVIWSLMKFGFVNMVQSPNKSRCKGERPPKKFKMKSRHRRIWLQFSGPVREFHWLIICLKGLQWIASTTLIIDLGTWSSRTESTWQVGVGSIVSVRQRAGSNHSGCEGCPKRCRIHRIWPPNLQSRLGSQRLFSFFEFKKEVTRTKIFRRQRNEGDRKTQFWRGV